MQRVVEHPGELLRAHLSSPSRSGRPTSPMKSVSPVSTAFGTSLTARSIDEDRDRLRRVARRLEKPQDDLAHADLVALPDRDVVEFRVRLRAEVDLRAGACGELLVAGHEVGVEVRLDDVPDLEALRAGLLDVAVDVAPRVDDRRLALRPDHVGGVGEAAQVELLEVHRSPRLSAAGVRYAKPLTLILSRREREKSGGREV